VAIAQSHNQECHSSPTLVVDLTAGLVRKRQFFRFCGFGQFCLAPI
jgi:hypothetical protein